VDDFLGRFQGFTPKFARRYAEFAPQMVSAIQAFKADVQAGTFPNNQTEATQLEPSVYQALLAELTVMETII
jgi:ketopantoate hydroxymethyltransferase